MEKKEIEIPIGDKKLVDFINVWQDNMPKEIFISLDDNSGRCIQDICMVREHYHFNEKTHEFVRDDSMIDCKVWGDSWSEDYTDEFVIGVYEEDDA